MTTFLVTIETRGCETTIEVDATSFFTGDDWVTFCCADDFDLPNPIVRFPRSTVTTIAEKLS